MSLDAVVHDFKKDLAYSDKASDESFWSSVYLKAFPDMIGHIHCDKDGAGQRSGIDRAIYLSNGKTIYVDEKKRREVYDDILLEYLSNDTTNALGWIEKPLAVDYLAYAFMPAKKVYLFPWDMLRRAWVRYKSEWMAKYPKKFATNKGYRTWSLAVPIKVLQEAVTLASVIQLQ